MSPEATGSQFATQYKAFSDDMRFYADQRFKIVTVFLVTTGLFANVANDHPSVFLGVAGVSLSYFCFCWEQATNRWWGTLITKCQEIETALQTSGAMIAGYRTYPQQNPPNGLQKWAKLRPSYAVSLIYLCGAIGWALYAFLSFPHLLAGQW
jgi:hypothetical protein